MSYYECTECHQLIDDDAIKAPMVVFARETTGQGLNRPYHIRRQGGMCGPLNKLVRLVDVTKLREHLITLDRAVNAMIERLG